MVDSGASETPKISNPEVCALCGKSEEVLSQFFVRMSANHVQGSTVVRRLTHHESRCCSACFRRIERLQTSLPVLIAIMVGPAAYGTLMVFIDQEMSSGFWILGSACIVFGVAALSFVSWRQRKMLSGKNVDPEFEGKLFLHQHATNANHAGMTPVTKVRDGSSFF